MNELRQAIRSYLDAIAEVSLVGTPELSHYTALANMFNAIGAQLTPRVRAVVHYSEQGGHQPDLGFFSSADEVLGNRPNIEFERGLDAHRSGQDQER